LADTAGFVQMYYRDLLATHLSLYRKHPQLRSRLNNHGHSQQNQTGRLHAKDQVSLTNKSQGEKKKKKRRLEGH
jgi:hypothetical protein